MAEAGQPDANGGRGKGRWPTPTVHAGQQAVADGALGQKAPVSAKPPGAAQP
jgi:hypothetical protein